jgi:predicted CoA-binding protein
VSDDAAPYGPSDQELRSILGDSKTIAVVGLSSNPDRPSNEVAEFLQSKGYLIVPVNPKETEILGERAYPSLLDVPEEIRIDVVDVFRRAEHTPEIAEQAVARGAKVLWLQEGIADDDARRIGEDAGLTVIMGLCIKKQRQRLEGGPLMQKWEYFVAPLLEHNPGEILNTFGEDGWELVSVAQIQNPMGGQSTVAYMKRPKG